METEIGSAAVVNVSDKCNTLGSVGIPFPKTKVKIVHPETQKELGYGEIGDERVKSGYVTGT